MLLRRALAAGVTAAVATGGLGALALTTQPADDRGELALAAATGCAKEPEAPTYTPTPTPTTSPTTSPTTGPTGSPTPSTSPGTSPSTSPSTGPSPGRATGSATATTTPTAPTTEPTPTVDPDPVTSVEMVQANIKSGTAFKKFSADLRKVFRTCPDFVTFNEVPQRQPQYLAPAGYALFRTPGQYTGANPVVWRTDRWTAEARGTTMISNLQGYGKGQHVMWGVRYANWVTLRSVDGKQTVSVVAVHIAPKSSRTTKLLAPSIKRLNALVGQLSASGPVLVGGDFNRHYKSSEYPRALLSAGGMNAVYDLSGRYQPTGDHFGATIDYVMVRPASVFSVLSQKTRELHSDHDAVVVELAIPERTTGEPGTSFSAGTIINEPTAVLGRARTTVSRSLTSALTQVPAGAELKVTTSALELRRLARKLRDAAVRGVDVEVVTGTDVATGAERWLTKRLAEVPGSFVRHRPDAFDPTRVSSTVLASLSGTTPWLTLDLDRTLGKSMVKERTVLRVETKKKAFKKQLRAFRRIAAPPTAEEPTEQPSEQPTGQPTGEPTGQPTADPTPAQS